MNKEDLDIKYSIHCLNEHHGYTPGDCKECNGFRGQLGLYPYNEENK